MTTTNTIPRIYPGLNCNSIEFFNTDGQVKAFTKGKMIDFEDLPFSYHQILKESLKTMPEAQAILNEWYPDSELHQIQKFVSCRFGGLDYTPDVKNYQLQDGEYWDCPLRGSCKGEGKVCKPIQYNNQPLETLEIKLLQLLITNDTNDVIADRLNIPMGTLHKLKRILYAKLNIQTKQGAAQVVHELNLV